MHLHFDCFSGISGDMTLGALVDAGLSPKALRQGLKALPVSGYRLKVSKVHRGAIHATKVDVVIAKVAEKRRSWTQIRRLSFHEPVTTSSQKTGACGLRTPGHGRRKGPMGKSLLMSRFMKWGPSMPWSISWAGCSAAMNWG